MTEQGRCVMITLEFEDGSERHYHRKFDNYILMAESEQQGFRNISMAGGIERNVTLLKILDSVITNTLMSGNMIGPDAAQEGQGLQHPIWSQSHTAGNLPITPPSPCGVSLRQGASPNSHVIVPTIHEPYGCKRNHLELAP